ncbi:TadA family conjugal transfer-associated ATPase [Nocardioides limicola]|uniref:TadA family conjugal transfer-associated ATPase n=1 Tax=Nocardioides limicola TaxID=2803368 RepID=UPI00193B8186|nr:TadA family conjugal transfer-associated ATPase [Nocardioides sp. DJM-14]
MTAVPAALVEAVRDSLARSSGPLSAQRVAEVLRAQGRPVGDAEVLAVHEALRRDVLGAGPLEPLLADPEVTDVLVNGPVAVHVDRGTGLELTGVTFADDEAVRRLARRLAAQAGRRLDEAMPYVDARLPDGSRLHAVLSPVASPGTLISIRVFRSRSLTLADMVETGGVTEGGAQLLQALVADRRALLVTGGTGTGKTTMLAALLSLVDPGERIVVVEDSAELRPDHPHVVGLEGRPANIEGRGEIALATLVRQALRMRPDRLVVGEVRGAEVVDLLAALNTGHTGGCGTLHANSASDTPARVEALALAAGLTRAAAHSQFGAAVEAVVHLARDRDGQRVLREIGVPERGGDGLVRITPAVVFGDGEARAGPAYAALFGDRR